MNSQVHFPALEINNFRTFKNLKIRKLSRVNLVVGKNNVGKTALLEALFLYARSGSISTIWNLIKSRKDEERQLYWIPSPQEYETVEVLTSLQQLFFRWPDLRMPPSQEATLARFSIVNPNDQQQRMEVNMGWLTVPSASSLPNGDAPSTSGSRPYPLLDVAFGDEVPKFYFLNDLQSELSREPFLENKISSVFLSAKGLDPNYTAKLWDNIATTAQEDLAIKALQVIEPLAERIAFVNVIGRQSQRLARLKISSMREPRPLNSMGDGMQRMLDISLALANCENGLLLIDEIESGLHYSVQPDMWRIIFDTCEQMNIQVVATTHSLDCIRAFQRIAVEYKRTNGTLISLRRKEKNPEEIIEVPFDEKGLTVIVEEGIEVR